VLPPLRLHLRSDDTVFLDKTGTLTYGIPVVDEVHTAAGISELTLLEAAAAAERHSEYPLGRAIVRYSEGKSVQASAPESFEYRIGRGILASAHGEE